MGKSVKVPKAPFVEADTVLRRFILKLPPKAGKAWLLYTLDGTTPQAAANGLKEVGRRVGPDGYTTELAGIPPGTVLAVTCTAVTVRLNV